MLNHCQFSTFKYFVICISIALFSCAKVGSPTGGEKDELPPKALEASPQNFSTEKSPKTISITFDEYIVIGNPEKDWIISPPLKYKPEAKLRSKTLVISLKDTLKEATTYTINFGESIKDLHEGNPISNFLYVFSTGTYIDSGRVSGKAIDAKTDKGLDKITVALFPHRTDSFPTDTVPLYITRSTENGAFQLPYLRNDTFRIFAWEDKNSNLSWEINEPVGYFPNTILPRFDSLQTDSFIVRLFNQVADTLLITKNRLYDNRKILLEFNRKPESDFNLAGKDIAFINNYKDSTVVWLNQAQTADSISFFINERTLVDTVSFFTIPPSKNKGDTIVKIASKILPSKPGDSLWITFSEPLLKDSFPIRYFVNKDSIAKQTTLFRSPKQATSFYGIFPTKLETQVRIVSAIANTGLYKSHLDSLDFSFGIPSKETFGVLKLKLKTPQLLAGNYFVLFGQEGKLKTYALESNSLQVTLVRPGKYVLYLVEDSDKNGQYTSGDVTLMKQPERVIKYPKAIDVRANWDFEIDWNVNLK